MDSLYQIDCFKINMKFWKVLGIWPGWMNSWKHYRYYSNIFVLVFVILYDLLYTINFIFLPEQIDIFIEEIIFYFTELSVASKVLTFIFAHEKIVEILLWLESETFQPTTRDEIKIMKTAKQFIVRYWKIVAVVSIISDISHDSSILLKHYFTSVKLELPICSYMFLSENIKERFIYPLFIYQSMGMHFHMLYNVNIDTFFLGLMVLVIAQLDILDLKLRNISENTNEAGVVHKLNDCIIHFDKVSRFCILIQEAFSVTLFIQFSVASCIICVCLFRFTLPAPTDYYLFLATYMFVMVVQILVPCWFGTKIIYKSSYLSFSIYNCDWTPRSREFKSNMRFFIERARRPLSIVGGKMFPLSLNTFTSIMNSAYSFFTLLRHMQSRV